MRVRISLDDDVVQMLRQKMAETGKSFNQTLNSTLRATLKKKSEPVRIPKFKVLATPMVMRPDIDPAGFNKMADGS